MRHRKAGRKLGRNSSHRKAMFKNMVTSLLRHDQIRTTVPKAKELRQHVEPLITIARKHAWSNYEEIFNELKSTLASLDSSSFSAVDLKTLQVVNDSAASVTGRFPSGLGRLSSALQVMDGFEEQSRSILRARGAQMKRQHAISQVKGTVFELEILERLFGELAETFKERNGGYTRVIRDGHREGDNADMAFISLVLEPVAEPEAPQEESADVEEEVPAE
jgi:ribosomal protein L17